MGPMKRPRVCPRCQKASLWTLKTGRKRCSRCRYTFTPHLVPGLRLRDRRLLRKVLEEFLLGHSTNQILQRCPISRRQLLSLLTRLRHQMRKDVPDVFSGVVEIDETYIGGKGHNMRLSLKRRSSMKRGAGTLKQPIFGILCRGGKVWAECIPALRAQYVMDLLEQRVSRGSIVCTDSFGYTGIAARGYVHRLVNHTKHEYSDLRGGHINGLEGFWGYLKRRLVAKGGIRRSRLPLYLAEYVWRYNHRKLSLPEQLTALEQLLPS